MNFFFKWFNCTSAILVAAFHTSFIRVLYKEFQPKLKWIGQNLPPLMWMTWFPGYGISVSQMTTDIFHVNTSRSFPHSRLIIGFVTRLKRRVPLVEQELPTLPEHLSSHPVFSGVRVTRSLVLYVCFVDRCLSFCTVSFGHCVVCSSSIYGF